MASKLPNTCQRRKNGLLLAVVALVAVATLIACWPNGAAPGPVPLLGAEECVACDSLAAGPVLNR